MPQTEHNCACGKQFAQFRSYSKHILKYKCHLKTSQIQPKTHQYQQQHDDLYLQNINTNLSNIQNIESESTTKSITPISTNSIAYKISNTNINPKIKCDYCEKLYSNHHIKTHKLKCKHKYKETYEYKLLVRVNIQDIPENYAEIRELFCKLLNDNPQIFTDLPPDKNAFEEFQTIPKTRGRPPKLNSNEDTAQLTNTNKKIYKKHQAASIINNTNNIINNHITNNTNNTNNITNNTNNIQQNNINFIINPIYNESIAHITSERQMFIILQRLHAFKALIDSVYETPANHNIYISDRKGEQVNYLDKEHGLNNGNAEDIIGNIAMTHLGHLDNLIEIHKNEVPEYRQNNLKFLEDLLLNEKNNPCVIKQLNEKISSLSGSSKILLDKYQKQKIIDYINSLPVGHFMPGNDDFNPELAKFTDPEPVKLG